MAKRPREMPPIYTVWRSNGGNDRHEIETTAHDTAAAAEIWARQHGREIDDRWWPIIVSVKDPSGEIWLVPVERRLVPEFAAGKPHRL